MLVYPSVKQKNSFVTGLFIFVMILFGNYELTSPTS